MTRLLDLTLTNSATIDRCPTTADAGTTLRVWREGHVVLDNYYHYGIADGNGGVIHASKIRGGVVHDESLEEFENGGVAQIDDSITSGDLCAAYEKAQSDVDKSYDLFSDNCEHFVRSAHGLKKECRQIHRRAIAGSAAVVAIKSKDPKTRTVAACVSVGSALSEKPIEGALAGFLIGLAATAVSKHLKKPGE